MPIRIVSDGVLTRSVRDTAAFLREAEQVYRALPLPPIGDVTRPGRKRLRVAVNTAGIGRDAEPRGRRADPEDRRSCSRSSATRSRRSRAPAPAATARRLPPLLVDARDDDRAHRPHARPARAGTAAGSTTSPSASPGTAAAGCTGCPARSAGCSRRPAVSAEFHATYDVALTPTLAHATPLVGHLDPTSDFDTVMERMLDWVAFTPWQNATGDPAISLPLATTAEGLPLGMMFAAGAGREGTLLELAYELEEARPWVVPGLDRARGRAGVEADFSFPRSLCVSFSVVAPLAQSAERLHGKEKVYGSIP